ncbi:MAG: PilZ domain-containing protein [Planctomycetota bacterium]|nr:PilZ domain-containing protein [Planctomycetota bacterium]
MSKRKLERRQYKRLKLSCPFAVFNKAGEILFESKSLNISDGGALLSASIKHIPPPHAGVKLNFSVPRSTPNSYMMEDFTCPGRVVRQQPLKDDYLAGVAFQFARPMQLALEV